ncbi:uncharacterized protein C12orf40 homolog [Ochotona princeps]|uniref:uncharacterized protein C12orf40 homolog n=1 Tax=Ochotona princeps TaxID=9978 RepID=UPI002714FFC7|nr:uncharacterized protein C12orf40 homolog [Ochotona princeps]
MNWVGGSRTRVLIKQERRKQKEYFEKNRLKSKMKLLGVSSPVRNAVSLDLLNLYMVNQISCKNKAPETVKKPTHVNMNRDIKMPLRRLDLELPGSPPCVPSALCLDDTEDNVHCQGPGNKEEVDPVQLSQIIGSYGTSVFEPQRNRAENCSFMPQSSAELPSGMHVPKQRFTLGTAPSPRKAAHEEKQTEQLFKLTGSQGVLTPSYKTVQFGKLFETVNSPGNGNLLTRRPAVIMGEECGSLKERRPSQLTVEEQSVQRIWGQNGKERSPFLKEKNKSAPILLSENYHSLIKHNMINLLNMDPQSMSETIDKCGYNSMGDFCGVASSNQDHSTDRYTGSIFPVPELALNNSVFNETRFPAKCPASECCWKNNDSSGQKALRVSLGEDWSSASSQRQGKIRNDYQEKMPQKNMQRSAENSVRKTLLQEWPSEQSGDFQRDQILVEERAACALQDRDSSSQSTSYSPGPTESCFTSSSDMLSEEEDQVSQHTEDSNIVPTKAKEAISRCGAEGDKIAENNAHIQKCNVNFHQFPVKNTELPRSQCHSTPLLQNRSHSSCPLQIAGCDAGVQTDSTPAGEAKADAAVQCDILPKCPCGRDVLSQ